MFTLFLYRDPSTDKKTCMSNQLGYQNSAWLDEAVDELYFSVVMQ
jgi:hypothetical protein